jgi:hypothetical protein
VLRTDDGGQTWRAVAQTPRENEFVTADAATAGPDGRLYVAMKRAGAANDGAWVYRSSELVVANDPPPFSVGIVALDGTPNPGVGALISIRLVLARAAQVELTLSDPLGRRVALLHDGPAPAGTLSLRFDAGALAPGAYLLRADTPAGAVTRMVTVLR